jgi:ribosomal protein S21
MTTDYHAKLFAHELRRRHSVSDSEKLAGEDKRAGLKFDLKELDDALKDLKRQIRQTGNLPDKLPLQRKTRDFEKKRDEAWRAYDEAAKHIEVEKDALLDRVEEQLAQSVATEDLFTITFQIA